MKKRMISVKLKDRIYPDGDLNVFIEELISIRNKYSAQSFSNLRLDIDHDYDYGSIIELWGDRLETDAQYQKRMKEEKNKKNKQLENERKQYEELKKKFEED